MVKLDYVFLCLISAILLLGSSCQTAQKDVKLEKVSIYRNYIFPNSIDGKVITLTNVVSQEEIFLGYAKVDESQFEVTSYERTPNGFISSSRSYISFVNGIEKLEKYTYSLFGRNWEVLGERNLSLRYDNISENSYEFEARMELSGGGFSSYKTTNSRTFSLTTQGIVEDITNLDIIDSNELESKERHIYAEDKGIVEVDRYIASTGKIDRFTFKSSTPVDAIIRR